jgi:pimeloyl-ACP methyl ester carboxylesterase
MPSALAPFAPLVPELLVIEGRNVEVFDVGVSSSSDPVVVLLTGAGDTARSWLPVQRMLSPEARVIAYERSGIGASEPGSPRRIAGFLAELDGVIAAVAPGSRMLLVGHSFGALLARVYAARHPERVTGLVLLDATPDRLGEDPLRRVGYRLYVGSIAATRRLLPGPVFGWLVGKNALPYYPGSRRFRNLLDARARREWSRAVRALYRGDAVAEMRAVLPGAAEAAIELESDPGAGREAPLGDLAVALLTSGTYGRGWITMHDAVARRYPNATHELSGDRFHHVHMRHASRTAELVRSLLAASRRETGSSTPEEKP